MVMEHHPQLPVPLSGQSCQAPGFSGPWPSWLVEPVGADHITYAASNPVVELLGPLDLSRFQQQQASRRLSPVFGGMVARSGRHRRSRSPGCQHGPRCDQHSGSDPEASRMRPCWPQALQCRSGPEADLQRPQSRAHSSSSVWAKQGLENVEFESFPRLRRIATARACCPSPECHHGEAFANNGGDDLARHSMLEPGSFSHNTMFAEAAARAARPATDLHRWRSFRASRPAREAPLVTASGSGPGGRRAPGICSEHCQREPSRWLSPLRHRPHRSRGAIEAVAHRRAAESRQLPQRWAGDS